MKFFKKNSLVNGRKNGFHFMIIPNKESKFYVTILHRNKDIKFNSLWSKIIFDDLDSAKSWCEEFKKEDYGCIGDDI